MKNKNLCASKYGNGIIVAEEFKGYMAGQRGDRRNIHHIRDVKPRDVSPADLYVFSSPGRIRGKPIGSMRRFLNKLVLPPGTQYGILTTQSLPVVKTGQMPTDEEQARWQRIIPMMNEILLSKGLKKVAEGKVLVTGIKGPLEDGWQKRVEEFAPRSRSPSDYVCNHHDRPETSPNPFSFHQL